MQVSCLLASSSRNSQSRCRIWWGTQALLRSKQMVGTGCYFISPCLRSAVASRTSKLCSQQTLQPSKHVLMWWNKTNPYHLAVMIKNLRMEIIQRLRICYPRFWSSVEKYLNTLQYWAAINSNSAAMMRELPQLHPAALEMKNAAGDTPFMLPQDFRELIALSPAARASDDEWKRCNSVGGEHWIVVVV